MLGGAWSTVIFCHESLRSTAARCVVTRQSNTLPKRLPCQSNGRVPDNKKLEGSTLRKTICIAVAAAFLSAGTAPAVAVFPFFIPVLMSKEDKNFKAVNPYAKKAVKKSKRSRR